MRRLDAFSYRDLSGRRHPRLFVVATGFLVGGLLLLTVLFLIKGWLEHADSTVPVDINVQTPAPAVYTPKPGTTPDNGCPKNPESWVFSDIPLGGNLKKITPVCAIDGLEQVIAWRLASDMGYNPSSAAALFGFETQPAQETAEITAMTQNEGPLVIPMFSAVEEYPSEYRQWLVDDLGNSSVVYTLRGCYRTYSVDPITLTKTNWGTPYSVICMVSRDQMGTWIVTQYEELTAAYYLHGALRLFELYGYSETGRWVYIGARQQPVVIIQTSGEGETLTAEIAINDQENISKALDVPVWDAAWLESEYALQAARLPADWNQAADPGLHRAIQQRLETWRNQQK